MVKHIWCIFCSIYHSSCIVYHINIKVNHCNFFLKWFVYRCHALILRLDLSRRDAHVSIVNESRCGAHKDRTKICVLVSLKLYYQCANRRLFRGKNIKILKQVFVIQNMKTYTLWTMQKLNGGALEIKFISLFVKIYYSIERYWILSLRQASLHFDLHFM